MYVFIIVGALLVFGPVLGLWPPVIRGSRTLSSIFFITMRESSVYTRRGRDPHAVLAGMVAEWWLRWSVAFLLALPSILFEMYPYQWLISLGMLLIASAWTALVRAEFDLLVKAVEIVADHREDTLREQAARMQRRWNGLSELPLEEIERKLRLRLPVGRAVYALVRRGVAVSG